VFSNSITLVPQDTPVSTLTPLAPFTAYNATMGRNDPTTTCAYSYPLVEPCSTHGNKMDFWHAVCQLLAENPLPLFSDEAIYVEKNFGLLGIHPWGCIKQVVELRSDVLINTLKASNPTGGYANLLSVVQTQGVKRPSTTYSPWVYLPYSGQWGNQYTTRAVTANRLLALQVNSDAAYWTAFTDSTGANLVLPAATHFYQINFQGLVPVDPVTGFWSITLYDNSFYMITSTGITHTSAKGRAPLVYPIIISSACSAGPTPCLQVPVGVHFNLIFRGFAPLAALGPDGTYPLPLISLH